MTADEVGLERRLRHAKSSSPFGQREPTQDRMEGGRPIAETMLLELGQLDRGDDCTPAGSGGEGLPGGDRLKVSAEPSKEMGSIDGDPFCGPGCLEGGRPRGSADDGPAPGPATEVCGPSRRPPGVVLEAGRLPDGDRPRADWLIRGSVDRDVEAIEGLAEPVLAGECAGQPRKVAGDGLRPSTGIAEPRLEKRQESGQRPHVLVVVADDIHEIVGGPAPKEPEIPAGDLPALEVTDPMHPQQRRLGGPQPGVLHPVPEQPADDWEKV